MPRTNPTHALKVARGLISGAAVSLEHCIAAESEASLQISLEQQAPFIIGELEHAVAQIRKAMAEVAPVAAPVAVERRAA